MRNGFLHIIIVGLFICARPLFAEPVVEYAAGLPNLTEIGLAQLMSLELVVTTIGKRERQVSNIPAAVHIITREEIIRSGVQNIADALRLAPGINVFQMSSNMYVVASRGLATEYSSKVALLIDGRSCFNPSFGGVTWDTQDVLIEDIDRIEIIRGPGDAIWGSNAINGVINVVTKTARNTLGSYTQVSAGTHDTGAFITRLGGVLNDVYYRAYVKANVHGNHPSDYRTLGRDAYNSNYAKAEGQEEYTAGYQTMGRDSSKKLQSGFRLDGGVLDKSEWSLQGYTYAGIEDERGKDISYEPPYMVYDLESNIRLEGGSLVSELKRQLDYDSKLLLRAYYDRRQMRNKLFKEYRDTLDVDAIVERSYGNHNLIWGTGYRGAYSSFLSRTGSVALIPAYRDQHELSVFLQDEYPFAHDAFSLQTSAKVEFRELLGWEYQPSVKLLWKPLDSHVFWTSVTRATATASDADRYIKWNLLVDTPMGDYYPVVTALGNRSLNSEVVIAYELGWRYNVSDKTSLDVAVFYNDYDDIKGEVLRPENLFFEVEGSRQRLILPLLRKNILAGGIYGVELFGRISPLDLWHLSSGYSYLKNTIKSDDPLFLEGIGMKSRDIDPEHKAFLNSRLDFADNWAWDVYAYYVDRLVAHKVPSYIRLDTRIGWKLDSNLEIELIGQNLLDNAHDEYTFPILPLESTRAETTFIGQVNYRY